MFNPFAAWRGSDIVWGFLDHLLRSNPRGAIKSFVHRREMKTWRTFRVLSAAEKAFLGRHHLTSETLEVCCRAGETSFSVVEKTKTGYSWAHFSCNGVFREMGLEVSRAHARAAVLEVQRLWSHRCASAGQAPCQGLCGKPRSSVA